MLFCGSLLLVCSVEMLNALNMKSDGQKIWLRGEGKYHSAVRMVYMSRQKLQLDDACYIVPDGIEDLLFSTTAMREVISSSSDSGDLCVSVVWSQAVYESMKERLKAEEKGLSVIQFSTTTWIRWKSGIGIVM